MTGLSKIDSLNWLINLASSSLISFDNPLTSKVSLISKKGTNLKLKLSEDNILEILVNCKFGNKAWPLGQQYKPLA